MVLLMFHHLHSHPPWLARRCQTQIRSIVPCRRHLPAHIAVELCTSLKGFAADLSREAYGVRQLAGAFERCKGPKAGASSAHSKRFAQFGCVSALSWTLALQQPRQVLSSLLNPFAAGQGVGAERFEVTLLRVVEQRPVQPEHAGFGVVNEAGRIVGAHLE